MSFQPRPDALRCHDCDTAITVAQHRRKRPRCDDCEVEAALLELMPLDEPPRPVRLLQAAVRPWRPPRRSWLWRVRLLGLRLECRIARDDAN